MCRSDHYSGQSSNTKESCSSTPLNRCTSSYYYYYYYSVSRIRQCVHKSQSLVGRLGYHNNRLNILAESQESRRERKKWDSQDRVIAVQNFFFQANIRTTTLFIADNVLTNSYPCNGLMLPIRAYLWADQETGGMDDRRTIRFTAERSEHPVRRHCKSARSISPDMRIAPSSQIGRNW